MEYTRITLPDFWVIGREGSTNDGPNFISQLWELANSTFNEVAHLAIPDTNGMPRVWGLMSDMTLSFLPWEERFTKGLYLAGIEVSHDAVAPNGWVKWHSPAYEYIIAPAGPDAFPKAIAYLAENGLELVGAAYDLTIPGEGSYTYLPIKKL